MTKLIFASRNSANVPQTAANSMRVFQKVGIYVCLCLTNSSGFPNVRKDYGSLSLPITIKRKFPPLMFMVLHTFIFIHINVYLMKTQVIVLVRLLY